MTLHIIFTLVAWQLGFRGRACHCGFYETTHYNIDLEFDMEHYPCRHFNHATHKEINMSTFETKIIDLMPSGVGISLEVDGVVVAAEKMVGAQSFVEFFTSMSDDISFRVNADKLKNNVPGDAKLVDVLVVAKRIWK